MNQRRFLQLWSRLGATRQSPETFAQLSAAYGEPHRAYHTAEHIRDCLQQLDAAPSHDRERDLVETAIWFHDLVYHPGAPDNEARSAAAAGRMLADAGVSSEFVAEVGRLILLTRHLDPPADSRGRLLCDVDLSILGRAPAQFAEFERRIRAEYARVPEPEYRAGRAQVLQRFLDRRPLYVTSYFRDRYEAPARLNLQDALRRPAGA
ncbi:MAG: HD domain-containing protein [Gemmatimonadales bacterium]